MWETVWVRFGLTFGASMTTPRRRFTVRGLLIITALFSFSLALITSCEKLGGSEFSSEPLNLGTAVGILGFLIASGTLGWIIGFAIRGTREAAIVTAAVFVSIMLIFIALSRPVIS